MKQRPHRARFSLFSAGEKSVRSNRTHLNRRRQFRTEQLEDRNLLAVLIADLGTDGEQDPTTGNPGIPVAAIEDAITSFHGEDGVGKDGPLSKLGADLTLLYHADQYDATEAFAAANPLFQFQNDLVAVDIVSSGNADNFRLDLMSRGLQVVASEGNVVSGFLPIDMLDNVASLGSLGFARPAYKPITEAGLVDSQGDTSLNSAFARTKLDVDGRGIEIGVVSDSYDALGTAINDQNSCTFVDGTCDVPEVEVIAENFFGTDEGRAMVQIVHDVAPGAKITFATAGSFYTEMATNIRRLADAGANIIVDDIGFFASPIFQDGVIARAVDDVVAQGVSYFSAAGNRGANSYESAFVNSNRVGDAPGSKLHDFDPSSAVDTTLNFTLQVGGSVTVVLQWDQPFGSLSGPGSASDLDIVIRDQRGNPIASGIDNNLGGDPLEVVNITNPGIDADGDGILDTQFSLEITHQSGPLPGLLKTLFFPIGMTVTDTYNGTSSSTIWGQKNAEGTFSVAASAFFATKHFNNNTVDRVNDYSALGGTRILFDAQGNRIAGNGIERQKPDATGPDGGNTTFFGVDTLEDSDALPNFFGTSAAAPHVAAVAALVLQAEGGAGSLSPEEVYDRLRSTATQRDITDRVQIDLLTFTAGANIPIADGNGGIGYDYFSGWGFVDAYAAITETVDIGTGTGSISGLKYHDLDGDGTRDSGEPGLAGWTIYIDLNQNGTHDANEPSAVTGADGSYTISGLPTGSFIVAEELLSGWEQITPGGNGTYTVTLGAGTSRSGINFGNRRVFSSISGSVWSDTNGDGVRQATEPGLGGAVIFVDTDGDGVISILDPQVVTNSSGQFTITDAPIGTVRLQVAPYAGWVPVGSSIVTVTVGAGESVAAVAFGLRPEFVDPGNGDPNPGPDGGTTDEPTHGFVEGFLLGAAFGVADGVQFMSDLHPGSRDDIIVTASQHAVSPGFLNVWIDLNDDGDYTDAGEHLIHGRRLASGANALSFQLPSTITVDSTTMMFRWGYERNQGPTGPSLGGEVEIYPVALNVRLIANGDTATVAEDSGATAINVLANDVLGPDGGTLTVASVTAPTSGGTVSIENNQILYTPADDFFGQDSFTYTLSDGVGNTGVATVTVQVTAVNDDPTAVDDVYDIPPNTSATVLDVLANDQISPDTGETLTIIAVDTATNGTVTNNGNQLTYRPNAGFEGLETFTYTISDGNGGESTATVTINVRALAAFRVETTDLNGQPISSVRVGDQFLARVYVQDLRPDPTYVFSAYADLLYSTAFFEANSVSYENSVYTGAHNATPLAIPGRVNDAGGIYESAVGNDFVGDPADAFLFSVTFTALDEGDTTLTLAPTGNEPLREVAFYTDDDDPQPVPTEVIVYGDTPINVRYEGAVDDVFTVLEDPVNNVQLNVLTNDVPPVGLGPLTIVNVSSADQGGSVSVSADGLRVSYKPAPNFTGIETFTYSVTDTAGTVTSATVSVLVTNTNDDPTAVDDVFFALVNIETELDVLANDSFAPDPFEFLTILDAFGTNQGGRVRVSDDRQSILYTPAPGFLGEETFTYVLSDGHNGTAEAEVTVNVREELPVPALQHHLVFKDATGNEITQIAAGTLFFVEVRVEDLRDVPLGIFSAYLDVLYSGAGVSLAGDIEYGVTFPTNHDQSTTTAGLVDELGGVANVDPGTGMVVGQTPGSAELLATIPLMASAAGTVSVSTSVMDIILPAHETSLNQTETRLQPEEMILDEATLTIGSGTTVAQAASASFQNRANRFDVNSDFLVTPLDALAIINALTSQGGGVLSNDLSQVGTSVARSAVQRANWIDVNGDGFLSPLDALAVVNELSRREQTAALLVAPLSAAAAVPASSATSDPRVTDQAILSATSSTTTTTILDAADDSLTVDSARSVVDRHDDSQQPLAIRSRQLANHLARRAGGAHRQSDTSAANGAWEALLDDLATDIASNWNR